MNISEQIQHQIAHLRELERFALIEDLDQHGVRYNSICEKLRIDTDMEEFSTWVDRYPEGTSVGPLEVHGRMHMYWQTDKLDICTSGTPEEIKAQFFPSPTCVLEQRTVPATTQTVIVCKVEGQN